VIYPDLAGIFRKVLAEDIKSQKHYVGIVMRDVRGIDYESVVPFEVIFIPNNEYLTHFAGNDIKNPMYGLYDPDGECRYVGDILIPLKLISGVCCGWVAFDPIVKARAEQTKDFSESYYELPPSSIMKKGKVLFVRPEVYKKSLNDEYICLIDGVFDNISLDYHGFNSGSFLGSEVNSDNMFLLMFIKNLIVIPDNDEAGLKFVKSIRKFRPDARVCNQFWCKDADDVLKSDHCKEFCDTLNDCINDRHTLRSNRLF